VEVRELPLTPARVWGMVAESGDSSSSRA